MRRADPTWLRRALHKVLLLACAAPASATTACSEPGASADAGARDAPADCSPSQPYFIDASYVMVGDANCAYFVDFPCGSSFQQYGAAACYLTPDDCLKACTYDAAPIFECQYWPGLGCAGDMVDAPPGQPTRVECEICSSVGRRPAGLLSAPRRSSMGDPLGDYFARAAHLEAASVHAFLRLARELRAHGAPRDLALAAERAERDEVRHARIVGRLARLYGAEPRSARVRGTRVRPLSTIALENAVEGCVRETFGAVVAAWQAAHAADPQVRAVMRTVARDEARHAALAWSVACWAEPRLEARTRTRIARAKRAAISRLRRDLSVDASRRLVREGGLPDRAAAKRLLDGMTRVIWLRR
ncbi:MAG TPA: ferritin-like domain-containing protein [Polyangiaceae bacterium]|nr:ferritin-like domain-containing protein [Polyangiaceae bacterium]